MSQPLSQPQYKSTPILATHNTRQLILSIVNKASLPVTAFDVRDELIKHDVRPKLNDIRRHLTSLCTYHHIKKHYDETIDRMVYYPK